MMWILLLATSISHAYGEENCPKKSTSFAFCVQASLMDHTYEAQDRAELSQFVYQDCSQEMKAYTDCDGIDKSAFANEFIQHQVEFFKKDRIKMIGRAPKIDSGEPNSSVD